MGKRLKKLRKIRLHHEGTHTLILSGAALVFLNLTVYFAARYFQASEATVHTLWTTTLVFSLLIYGVVVNFFRCPPRTFEEDTTGTVVAPADGKVVVIEEVEENEYFHDRRLMVSIFMNVFNVHANWIPVDGQVKYVRHHDGNFRCAWLPKASVENERSTIVIRTPEGQDILTRQVAGAMARRIVTYLQEGEHHEIDDHMGFIKFGSRVDVYLPLGTEVCVELGQKTTGNETVIARLK